MTKTSLIRAWKDEEYRRSLSEAERALLPECPVGSLELVDEELDTVAGGDCFITVYIACLFYSVVCFQYTIVINNG